MNLSIRQTLTTNALLNVCAAALGYTLWYRISRTLIITLSLPLVIEVHHAQHTEHMSIPRDAYVIIQGKRSDLERYCWRSCTLAIDRTTLSEGITMLTITAQDLHLPSSITLVDCNPRSLPITITPHKEA